MVTRWGFSKELGAVANGENQEEVFLGHSVSRTQNISEATAQKIDSEVRRLVEDGHLEAKQILEAKRADLEALAKGLIEYETLTGDEIKDLIIGKPPVRGEPAEGPAPRSTAVPRGNRRPGGASGPMEPQPQS
jgi:cell division protease FtsH